MHLHLVIGTLLCISATVSFGQSASDTTYIGGSVGGGVAFTCMSPKRIDLPHVSYLTAHPSDLGEAFTCNLFVSFKRNHWILQPSLFYHDIFSSKFNYSSGSGSWGISVSPSEGTTNFEAQQLGIGTSIGRAFGSADQFYVMAGPAIAWRVDKPTSSPPSASSSASDDIQYAVESAAVSQQIQLIAELGWWLDCVSVNMRLHYGLTPLVKRVKFDDILYPVSIKNTAIMVTLGYRLPMRSLSKTN